MQKGFGGVAVDTEGWVGRGGRTWVNMLRDALSGVTHLHPCPQVFRHSGTHRRRWDKCWPLKGLKAWCRSAVSTEPTDTSSKAVQSQAVSFPRQPRGRILPPANLFGNTEHMEKFHFCYLTWCSAIFERVPTPKRCPCSLRDSSLPTWISTWSPMSHT